MKKIILIASVTLLLSISQKASSDDYYPNCVRSSANLNESNAATVKAELCKITSVQAQLQGVDGLLDVYEFKSGADIRVFRPTLDSNSFDPFDPVPILYSIGNSEWKKGWSRYADLLHDCPPYQCHWTTIRDDDGTVVVASGVSI
jgi:hypothetical protein